MLNGLSPTALATPPPLAKVLLEFSLMLQPYAARFPAFMGGLPNAV